MQTQNIPIILSDNTKVYVEATVLGGEQNIVATQHTFSAVTEILKEISEKVLDSVKQVKPKKASVEFGLEIATESGKLTALLVKGTGTASLKVTLEWEDS